MKPYTNNEPSFSETISIYETTDLVNADDVMNVPIKKLMDNTLNNKSRIDQLESSGLTRQIVNSLPTTDIKTNVIYMILDPDASGSDIYDEWMWVNNAWERIGSTRVDISDYMKKGVDYVTAGKEDNTTLGQYATAEGLNNKVTGTCAHAEGISNTSTGNYSHVEGFMNTVSAESAHAEGAACTASGLRSHAEGNSTKAYGGYSHAEGSSTTASGSQSHAEGASTVASGASSHAEGHYTTARGDYQHVAGKFNLEDSNNTYARITGGGSANNNRANIETLDWQGNLTVAGNVIDGDGNKLSDVASSVNIQTVVGNPITLTDAANANAEELLMTIEPIQSGSGDPSPTNVRPISGLTEGKVVACGKNIAHIDSTKIYSTNKNPSDPITGITDGMLILGAAANGYIRTATLGSYTINNPNSITAEIVDNASFGVGIVVKVDTSKTYALNLVKTGGDVEIGWLNNDGSSLSSAGQQTLPVNLTPPTGAKYLLIVCLSGLTEHTFSNIQLEEGTTATTFEPYTAATATITFGQTVYGGSVNFKTGEVTVTHGFITFDGSEPWYTNGDRGVYLSCVDISPNIKANGELKFSDYVVIDKGDAPQSNGYANFNISGSAIQIHDENGMTSAAYKTYLALHNVQLCYELATPTTLTLTPAELELLKGNNTITANGAEISIEYYPDNAIGALAGRVDGKADEEDVAVPKYDATNRREYYEGGAAFDGNIDSSPTAGSNNAVASGGTKTYVDNAIGDLASKLNWKAAGAFNANGDVTLDYSLDSASEMMITLFLGLPRQTVLIDSISRLRQYNLFPDFLTYEGRVYARITYVDATHVTISQLTGLSALGPSAQLIIEIR